MSSRIHIEVNCQQINHGVEKICGDVFVSKRIKEEGRLIMVLSDGMGHGVKANVLATLTATMALNFTIEHKDVSVIAEIIMNTLPICSERKISYSTFTIVDINGDGETTILEYDNPQCIVLRGNQIYDPKWQQITLQSEANKGKEIRTCRFYPQKEDRIIFTSDGVAQSGMGSVRFPFGWERDNVQTFCINLVENEKAISASRLAAKVVNYAHINDGYRSKDDTSCAVVYFREPRKMLLCTGPPYEEYKDAEYAEEVKNFKGKIVLSGATTADIVARELKREITDTFDFDDPDLPPLSFMEGIDFITEGILTLTKATEILRDYSNNTKLGKGPADRMVKLFLESDEIHFIIGTRINIAHQDPNLPVELEIRRTVVKRIARILEDKFLKEVSLKFI